MHVLARQAAPRFGALEYRLEVVDQEVELLGRGVWLALGGNVHHLERDRTTGEIDARTSLNAPGRPQELTVKLGRLGEIAHFNVKPKETRHVSALARAGFSFARGRPFVLHGHGRLRTGVILPAWLTRPANRARVPGVGDPGCKLGFVLRACAGGVWPPPGSAGAGWSSARRARTGRRFRRRSSSRLQKRPTSEC